VNRREFVRDAGIVAGITAARPSIARSAIAPLTATLTIDPDKKLAAMPTDFSGLSYETAQLANPSFFAADNKALVDIFRGLSTQGVLRIGGGTSEFTTFTTEEPTTPPPFDAVGPDTSKNVKSNTPITPKALRNLRAFLDAAGWRALYGLNLGQGTTANAAGEAFHAQQILGPRLIAFQLGNEPDAWRTRYRPATYAFPDFFKEWQAMREAVLAQTPKAKFAGPDISNKVPYFTSFAEEAPKITPDIVLLTAHYYAMGPAGSPGVTLDKLLSPDPKLERDLKSFMDASRAAGLPFRMSEGNSCWNGGQPGVSDTLASALWSADMMLQFAAAGCAGVNMHGGGNGFYTPIAGSLAAGFTRRPEYFGMQLAEKFSGSTLLQTTLQCSSERVRIYAAEKSGRLQLVVINKTEQAVSIAASLPKSHSNRPVETWSLSGPAMDQKDGVTLTMLSSPQQHGASLEVAPHSAMLWLMQK
jgi:hypothetical protein